MVLIIELDREDGGWVEVLSVKLMEGAESLYNKIGGTRNWRPRWVINVLIGGPADGSPANFLEYF
jgi:hypothetical protein